MSHLDKELIELLKAAADEIDSWSEEQRKKHTIEQCISFAYGNLKLHNPNITKDDVRKASKELGD